MTPMAAMRRMKIMSIEVALRIALVTKLGRRTFSQMMSLASGAGLTFSLCSPRSLSFSWGQHDQPGLAYSSTQFARDSGLL